MKEMLSRVPEDLHARLKERARELGKTVNALVVELLAKEVQYLGTTIKFESAFEQVEHKLWDFIVREQRPATFKEAMLMTNYSRQRLRDRFAHLLCTGQQVGDPDEVLHQLTTLESQLSRQRTEVFTRRDVLRYADKRSPEQESELQFLEKQYDVVSIRHGKIFELVEELRKEQEQRREAEERRERLSSSSWR
jgi:hypothetical protein